MKKIIPLIILFIISGNIDAQILSEMILSGEKGLFVESFVTGSGKRIIPIRQADLFSFRMNGRIIRSSEANVTAADRSYRLNFRDSIIVMVTLYNNPRGITGTIEFMNNSQDSIILENVVPFGEDREHMFITAAGPPALARAQLFRPGKIPVSIILPDNAWELGYGSLPVNTELSVCALVRRTSTEECIARRYLTIIPPGRSAGYELYADGFEGEWQNGIRLMFRDRYLYDLDAFDNHLYERADLDWIKNAFIISLLFTWDHSFYDPQKNRYRINEYMDKGAYLFGGYDVIGIWPTWPRLGVDERNQWDLYRDMPGGLLAIRGVTDLMHARGVRFFIAYNPWDNSTRTENHLQGLSDIIEATDADGVVLDTQGKSSAELQEAADRIRKGIIMYSEGMAVTADMPGIIAGRVHDAINLQPLLNMNRVIKPDFSIFRVCHLRDGRLHSEVALSLFNGAGTELISFAPDRPDWMEEEFMFLGKTTIILRENPSLFKNPGWTFLVDTRCDSIWANEWCNSDKKLYTVFSLIPEGFKGPLIPCEPSPDKHYISLWHHCELLPELIDSSWYLPVMTDAFHYSWLGTRQEGSVDCIAEFSRLLQVSRKGDSLYIDAVKGDRLLLWKGNPSCQNTSHRLTPGFHSLKISDIFGDYEGKIVVQLFRGKEILDARILEHKTGTSWLASDIDRTDHTGLIPPGMVLIPGAEIKLRLTNPEQLIPYPDYNEDAPLTVSPFLMDVYPVTNKQYHDFIEQTGYTPLDTCNFLKHWSAGIFKPGEANLPVVYINLEDAKAYARWAGKRLPSEAEWQLTAQGTDGRKWPWGNQMEEGRCNQSGGHPTSVDAFPRGSSPFGVRDLIGNVWQLTGDVYENGSYTYMIIRGGSFFDPASSWWYVKGGPQPLDQTQMLILMSPGFDRCSSVGFRCARDIMQK
jgi:formylglycine-generating enzyme required for sulfatase activity